MLLPNLEFLEAHFQLEKNKKKIFKQHNSGQLLKPVKPEKYDQVNKAVYKCLVMLGSENIPVGGPMLKGKALEFAKELGIESFEASDGLLITFLFLFCFTLREEIFTGRKFREFREFCPHSRK